MELCASSYANSYGSLFLKKWENKQRSPKNFLFYYICQIWAFSLVLPLHIVEVVILHLSQKYVQPDRCV